MLPANCGRILPFDSHPGWARPRVLARYSSLRQYCISAFNYHHELQPTGPLCYQFHRSVFVKLLDDTSSQVCG